MFDFKDGFAATVTGCQELQITYVCTACRYITQVVNKMLCGL